MRPFRFFRGGMSLTEETMEHMGFISVGDFIEVMESDVFDNRIESDYMDVMNEYIRINDMLIEYGLRNCIHFYVSSIKILTDEPIHMLNFDYYILHDIHRNIMELLHEDNIVMNSLMEHLSGKFMGLIMDKIDINMFETP